MVGGAVTRHPSASRRVAIAAPMPELEPVTTAVRMIRQLRLEVHALQQIAGTHDFAPNEFLRVVDAFSDRFDKRGRQPLDDRRIAHGVLHELIDLRRNIGRRALRRPHAVPGVELEAGQAGSVMVGTSGASTERAFVAMPSARTLAGSCEAGSSAKLGSINSCTEPPMRSVSAGCVPR